MFAPAIRELLQELLRRVYQAELPASSSIEERLLTEAARRLAPDDAEVSFAVGMPYQTWGERCKATRDSTAAAFHRLAHAATTDGRLGTLTRPFDVTPERAVRCELRVVRPGDQKMGAAGFEVRVLFGDEEVSESIAQGPQAKRTTKATRARAAAVQAVRSHIRADSALLGKLARLDAATAKGGRFSLARIGNVELVVRLRRSKVALALVYLLLGCGVAYALPKVIEAIEEIVAPRTGAPPTPTPRPTPYPTPSAVLSFAPPPLVAVAGLTHTLTIDKRAGDVPSTEHFTLNLGLQPFLYLAAEKACSRCVFLLAYPALTDPRPLRFHVEFGDGVSDRLEAVTAVPPGALNLRRRGVFHLTEPPWLTTAYFAQSWHQYPDADTAYTVRVAVEAVNPSGPPTTLVTLERSVRVEARAVVSTDATITIPTPVSSQP